MSPLRLSAALRRYSTALVVDGELEHKDSLGGMEIMKRGDVQMTSTGTGISHSEYNRHPTKPVVSDIYCLCS